MRPGLWVTAKAEPNDTAALVLEVDRYRYLNDARYHQAVERLRVGGLAAIIDGDPV